MPAQTARGPTGWGALCHRDGAMMRRQRAKRPEQLAPRVASGPATRRHSATRCCVALWRQLGEDAPTKLGYMGWCD